ncbi:MAG: hypothetical protein GWN14_07135 [candidate division Zixibacteria bacterium]|nr:hypothetical protein [Gammaproteobacteria bacterium]NIX55698.1 hypothetical protein [candidate division Zixibacteria bacterium]
MENSKRTFNRGDWFRLFLVCAFPLHLWTILMVFRDVNWVAERTTSWDALGFSSYALLYTLVESLLLFVFIALLSLLVPKRWDKTLRFVILSLIAFALAGWSIMEQLILIVLWDQLQLLGRSLTFLGSAPWTAQALFAGLVLITVAIPFLLLKKFNKLQEVVFSILERLTLLSALYIVMDMFGIVIIIIRNIQS